MAGRILVGTCNWSDHQGFYPKGMSPGARLGYYARFFPLVEVDSTYYGIPPPSRSADWVTGTPEGFLFNVKAFRSLTYHEREGGRPREPSEDELSRFRACLLPLQEAERLRAIHYQFPPWFKASPLNRDRLARLPERHPSSLIVVELRNRSWSEGEHLAELIDLLTESKTSLCVVDEPQLGSGSFPTVPAVTDPRLAVVRFHGRNARTWYAKGATSGDRFAYLYSEAELQGILPEVRRLSEEAEEIHLLFNNNRSNYAVVNALQMAGLLELGLPSPDLIVPDGPEPDMAPELPLGRSG